MFAFLGFWKLKLHAAGDDDRILGKSFDPVLPSVSGVVHYPEAAQWPSGLEGFLVWCVSDLIGKLQSWPLFCVFIDRIDTNDPRGTGSVIVIVLIFVRNEGKHNQK